jgi:hypothetical protein
LVAKIVLQHNPAHKQTSTDTAGMFACLFFIIGSGNGIQSAALIQSGMGRKDRRYANVEGIQIPRRRLSETRE